MNKISWPSKYGNNGWISDRKEEKSHVKNNLIAVLLMKVLRVLGVDSSM